MTTKIGINGFGHIGRLDWSQILKLRYFKSAYVGTPITDDRLFKRLMVFPVHDTSGRQERGRVI
jgi:glyceraldehyde-3-phosphate dehydrogenase/erythrose-4-phosphate dehydrogenase